MEKPNKALAGLATSGGWLRAALLPGLVLGLMLGCGGANSKPAAPTITSVTPMYGSYPTATNNQIAVTGSGFVSGVSSLNIYIGNVLTGTVTLSSDTQFTFLLPATAVTAPIRVVTDGGTASTVASFVVVPTVTGITTVPASAVPAYGPVATQVTITGYGLAGITGITMNGTSGLITMSPPFITQTAESLTFSIPPNVVVGSNSITLINTYGSVALPIPIQFTVTP